MTEWKPSPLKPLEELMTQPIRDALAEIKKQLEADQASLREFQTRLERTRKPRP